MFAEVAVNVPGLSTTYHYAIPDELAGRVVAGHLATVPFGGRRAQALVVGLSDEAPVENVKPLEELVDDEPVLTRQQLDLAYWIAHHYLTPLIECLTLMLPPGLAKKADVLYSAVDDEVDGASPAQAALLRVLRARGPLRGRQLDRALRKQSWRAAADALYRKGALTKQGHLEPPSIRAKHVRTARLIATPAQVEEHKPNLSRSAAKAARLAAALDFLAAEGGPTEVSWVYAASKTNLQDLRSLVKMGLVDLGQAESVRDPLAGQDFATSEPPALLPDQLRVWEVVRQAIERAAEPGGERVFLLHGVTGSGKTEIYLRALAAALALGRRAVVLVPEIALTPQTVRRFAARFPGRVTVWHSELSDGERYDNWRRAREGRVDVVIGPRSALFAPLPDLGLIVLDEEHDEAYKQDPPQSVPYHARDTAIEYARRQGAVCLMGSATPDVGTYFRARRGDYQLLELPRRIMGHTRQLRQQAERYHVTPGYHPVADGPADAQVMDLPPVDVVDMRQELRAGNTSIFSRKLRAALAEVLARGQQAILFLNRRGAATFVFCRDCGQALKCPRCDVPLTQHRAGGELICHHCNHRQPQPDLCPHCGSARVKFFGAGTEKLMEAAQAEFPDGRFLRWDRDVTRHKGAHDLILQQFTSQQADVLIGTQMIAKGLDLPLVTLVGVVAADVGLGLPDYRAAERTFQVLTQVAGRAGRGLLGGRVVLQTYVPDHYVVQAAARHDYGEFYQREMRYRKDLGLPPFRRMMRLVYRHADAARAEAEANGVAAQLRARHKELDLPVTEIVGPAPCFFGRLAGEHRWQVVVRSPDPAALARGQAFRGWVVDVDPLSTL